MKYFERQLDLAKACRLPVIFHNRNTDGDFETVVKRRLALNQHHSTSSLTPTEKLAVLLLYCCFTAALLLLYCFTERGMETQVRLRRMLAWQGRQRLQDSKRRCSSYLLY